MPSFVWDEATGYDLFVSLYVLHRPEQFGLRASWAAGVRSRIPGAQREFLEKAQSFLPVPLRWLYLLPAGFRNAAGAISVLAQLNTAERLPSLSHALKLTPQIIDTLRTITLRQSWGPAELEVLRTTYQRKGILFYPNALNNLCEAWAHPDEFGERYLQALSTYYTVFFAEEEERIRPALSAGVLRAQELAQKTDPAGLLDELSRGVHFGDLERLKEIILVPSYWANPLVFYDHILPESLVVLFGCRPDNFSLVPGEAIPGALIDALKALADPSRLTILRHLAQSPQTPSQLARRMRLRPPTVIHHLNALRLAGLVEVNLQPGAERCYSLREEALKQAQRSFDSYIHTPFDDGEV